MSLSSLSAPPVNRDGYNLRPRKRRRYAAGSHSQSQSTIASIYACVSQHCRALIWVITNPFETCTHIHKLLISTWNRVDSAFRDTQTNARVWKPAWLAGYIPLLIWLAISLTSTLTIVIWHNQVFQGLDHLAVYIQSLGLRGRLILGTLIFLTTFPPLPLYSTLIILCGFTFGILQGFIISYIAALTGAVTVFLMSRGLLRTWMVRLLNRSDGLKRVVHAIERRPKLLFLVRLAPYPYNLMNTLLASSPTLSLKTYSICTALALPKLLVHCGLGATIKNFSTYNGITSNDSLAAEHGSDGEVAQDSKTADFIKQISSLIGLSLCIGIFIYLIRVTRRAVDEELDENLAEDVYEDVWSEEEEGEEDDILEKGCNKNTSHVVYNPNFIDEDLGIHSIPMAVEREEVFSDDEHKSGFLTHYEGDKTDAHNASRVLRSECD